MKRLLCIFLLVLLLVSSCADTGNGDVAGNLPGGASSSGIGEITEETVLSPLLSNGKTVAEMCAIMAESPWEYYDFADINDYALFLGTAEYHLIDLRSSTREYLKYPLEYEKFYNNRYTSAWYIYGLNDDLRVRRDVFLHNLTSEAQVWFQGQKVSVYDTKNSQSQRSDPYSGPGEALSKQYHVYENEQIQCLINLDGLGVYSEDIAPLGAADYIIKSLSVGSSGNIAETMLSAEEIKQYAIKNYFSDFFPGESANDFEFICEIFRESQYRLYCQSNTPYPHSAVMYLTNDGQLAYAWINRPNYPNYAKKAEDMYNALDTTALETRFTEEYRHPGCNCWLKGIFLSHEAVLYKGKPLLMIAMRIEADPSVSIDWVGETGYAHSTYYDYWYSVFYPLD